LPAVCCRFDIALCCYTLASASPFKMSRIIAQRTVYSLSRSRLVSGRVMRPTPRLSYALSTTPRLREEEHAQKPVQRKSTLPDWSAPIVTYEELKPLTEQPSDKVVLIDVREPEEIAQGSIPSSVALPLSIIREALLSPPDSFKQKYGFPKPGTGEQEVIFYCRSGKRSATACDEAVKQGWKGVKNYEGSWLDWVKREAESRQA